MAGDRTEILYQTALVLFQNSFKSLNVYILRPWSHLGGLEGYKIKSPAFLSIMYSIITLVPNL